MDSKLDRLAKAIFDTPDDSAVCYTYLLETGLFTDVMLKNTPVNVICRTAYLVLMLANDDDLDAISAKFSSLGI